MFIINDFKLINGRNPSSPVKLVILLNKLYLLKFSYAYNKIIYNAVKLFIP